MSLYEELNQWTPDQRRKYLESASYTVLKKYEYYKHVSLDAEFFCTAAWMLDGKPRAILTNIVSGWCFDAVGTISYSDGRIEWDYSQNGRFIKEAL